MTHLRFCRTTTCFPRFAFLFRSHYDQPVYVHRSYYQHRREIFRREPNCKILRRDIFLPFLVSSPARGSCHRLVCEPAAVGVVFIFLAPFRSPRFSPLAMPERNYRMPRVRRWREKFERVASS